MEHASFPRRFGHARPGRILVALAGRLGTTVRTVAFWLAVALPLVYLPLAVVVPGRLEAPLLGLAVAGNLVALFVGHAHDPMGRSLGSRGAGRLG